jgi:periplasmic protein CpxP/Spy
LFPDPDVIHLIGPISVKKHRSIPPIDQDSVINKSPFYISLQAAQKNFRLKRNAPRQNTRKRKLDDQHFKRYQMSLKSRFSSAITLVFAAAAFAVVGLAQEAPKTQDDSHQKLERHHGMRGDKAGRHGGKRGMRGGMFGLRGIELTDAQKEQIRQIHEANKPSESQMAEMKAFRDARKSGGEITDAQRQQIKAFREQMRSKHEAVQAQILAILTPEQRTQLEAKKAERQNRREEFRQKRQERKLDRDAAKPTDNN